MDSEKEEISEWKRLRLKLNQQYTYDNKWEEAISLFSRRFKKKYFDPIQQLIDEGRLKGEGFTILTVQCALIEAFASLRTGMIFDHKKNKNSPKYTYSGSQEMFTGFLHTAAIFEHNFWIADPAGPGKRLINQPFDAEAFYKDVRCGLMHEARTKGNWIINAAPLKYKTRTEKVFIEKGNQRLKIYRTILHYRLKQYLKDYASDLQQPGADGETLRRYFARKMDHIFEETPDPLQFDWWIDS